MNDINQSNLIHLNSRKDNNINSNEELSSISYLNSDIDDENISEWKLEKKDSFEKANITINTKLKRHSVLDKQKQDEFHKFVNKFKFIIRELPKIQKKFDQKLNLV